MQFADTKKEKRKERERKKTAIFALVRVSRTGRTALLSVISEEEKEKEKEVKMTVTVKRLAFVGALDGEARGEGKVACLFFSLLLRMAIWVLRAVPVEKKIKIKKGEKFRLEWSYLTIGFVLIPSFTFFLVLDVYSGVAVSI